MPIYPNFYQTLTPCPIVELRGYAAANGLKGRLFAYLDFNGPTGTARDGLAEGMLALAIEQKKLAPGQPIIEAVSGPFATALTLAGLAAHAGPEVFARGSQHNHAAACHIFTAVVSHALHHGGCS